MHLHIFSANLRAKAFGGFKNPTIRKSQSTAENQRGMEQSKSLIEVQRRIEKFKSLEKSQKTKKKSKSTIDSETRSQCQRQS